MSSNCSLNSLDSQHAHAEVCIICRAFTYSSLALWLIHINKTCITAELNVHYLHLKVVELLVCSTETMHTSFSNFLMALFECWFGLCLIKGSEK
jgi:hypothetical protein